MKRKVINIASSIMLLLALNIGMTTVASAKSTEPGDMPIVHRMARMASEEPGDFPIVH